MQYNEFLARKNGLKKEQGFEPIHLNKNLFDFQREIVIKALRKARYAIFADCGLGKTIMQLEFADQVVKHTKKPVLILCPLAVASQTIDEGVKFGYLVEREIKDIPGIYITNYEQIENIDPSIYSGIILDESSILKNYEGSYKKLIIENFKYTEYKLACTATPSPNDPMELGNHAEFLNVMTRQEMLSMYFVHDGGETSKWRIKGHAFTKFYEWVNTWAIMLTKPSDIGYKHEGYNLPELIFQEHIIKTEKRDGFLFNDIAVSAINFNAELRATKEKRLAKVIDIVNSSDKNFIIWVKQNEEGEYLKKMITDSVEVKGSDSNEYKEKMLLGFAKNEFRVLITKSKIAQFGLNYQNCNNQVFASLDFSFESLYQSIRRSYRFGQKQNVNIHIISTDTMQNVVQSIKNKELLFKQMHLEMIKNLKYE